MSSSALAALPSRKAIGTLYSIVRNFFGITLLNSGGSLLDKYSSEAESSTESAIKSVQNTSGGRINFLSDGWENVSKSHILGVVLGLYGVTMTYGAFPCGDRHDGLALAMQTENLLLKMKSQGLNVGAVVTDDAGQCARMRRILALRWPSTIFLMCMAHQVKPKFHMISVHKY